MMRPIALFLLACTLLLGGCASTLGTKNTGFVLSSEPSGATVYINGNEKGTTPYTYHYDAADGMSVEFEFRLSGYQSERFIMKAQQNNGLLFVDAMLLGIPYIVDHRSSALYKTPTGGHTVHLYKEFSADQRRYDLPVTGVEVSLPSNAPLGTYGSTKLKRGTGNPMRDLEYGDMLNSAVVAGLKDTWLQARSVKMGTTKGDEAIQRAKLHLRPRIDAVQASFTGKKNRCSGPLRITGEWRFVSALKKDSVLFSLPLDVTYHALNAHIADVFSDALRAAARQLAGSPDLDTRVSAAFDAGLKLSKGASMVLSPPVPIVFNGRKEMLSALVKAVVTIQTDDGHGSGFTVTNDGYIITNEHVVGNATTVKAKFEQGFTLDAQVVKTNSDLDLALLKVSASHLPALSIGDDAGLLLGEEIFAIGTPLDTQLGQSVSRGILSGRRNLDGRAFLQTDVSINPGNSGGPFIDETGKVVGVATMKISGKGLEGLGFGVPISVALEMLNVSFAQ
jgi:S1-C subfamily serine protease